MREQLWIVPGADPAHPLRAIVFRPQANGADQPRPLVVINHGTSEDTRLAVSMPVYYWMSRWFVERGFVVMLPQRRGHGATGGPLAEGIGDCRNPDHARSGETAADDILAALRFMQRQPFVQPTGTLVAGVSTGGWASLALSARNPEGVRAVINFAGGRGGHAFGRRGAVCAEDRLIAAAASFAEASRIPTLWFYAQNDSYFGHALASRLAGAWAAAGASVDLRLLPAYGSEGHLFPEDRASWSLWGDAVENFLAEHPAPAAPETPDEGSALLAAFRLW